MNIKKYGPIGNFGTGVKIPKDLKQGECFLMFLTLGILTPVPKLPIGPSLCSLILGIEGTSPKKY